MVLIMKLSPARAYAITYAYSRSFSGLARPFFAIWSRVHWRGALSGAVPHQLCPVPEPAAGEWSYSTSTTSVGQAHVTEDRGERASDFPGSSRLRNVGDRE